MSDNEKFYGDDENAETGSDKGIHLDEADSDTEGHMHPDEFPQGPIRRNDDGAQGNLPQS